MFIIERACTKGYEMKNIMQGLVTIENKWLRGLLLFMILSCVLSSLTFTGRFGFILVIPSEVQENVTEAPEKPGKFE